jgi:probable sporulation protein (polysaccharide deacetylase family)
VRRWTAKGAFLLICLPVLWGLVTAEPVDSYVSQIKEKAEPVWGSDDLYARIRQEAQKRGESPIDARIDRVWKAIPGYDGLQVDVEATYRLAKRKGWTEPKQWIYRVVPARVTLDDLGPHPIYRGNERKPMAALMINVAWGTEHLPAMLNILRKEQVKATFFLDGSWLKRHPTDAKRLKEAGHEIGNHAYSHPMMSRLSRERMRFEMKKTEQLIRQTLGVRSQWFAPPAGDYNQAVVEEAARLHMKTVLWTVDTVDWRPTSTPEWMTARVKAGVANGMLVLMHPTDRTVTALPQIISVMKQNGIKLGTVSEVLSSSRVESVEPAPPF